MQVRDNGILNQEEVVTVGNKERFGCRVLRTTTKKPMRTWQLWEWGMRKGEVGEHEHLESQYLEEWLYHLLNCRGGDEFSLLTCWIRGTNSPFPLLPTSYISAFVLWPGPTEILQFHVFAALLPGLEPSRDPFTHVLEQLSLSCLKYGSACKILSLVPSLFQRVHSMLVALEWLWWLPSLSAHSS